MSKNKADTSWITDDLLDALAYTESGMDPNAVSPSGASGLYQWMPAYFKEGKEIGFGVDSGAFDPTDPVESRKRTKQYLEGLQKYYPDWDPTEILMAYNWGHGNVRKFKSGELDIEKYMSENKWQERKVSEAMNYANKVIKNLYETPWAADLDERPFGRTI
jgi:soluble lytic murein transglycosylase-like protein